jgi:F-type H+-transporting ATPase subunit b
MHLLSVIKILAQEETSEAKDLYPHVAELIVGAVGFLVLLLFMAKWVFPRVNKLLAERQGSIQSDLEKAEQAKKDAEQLLADYRTQLAGARDEANRIVEESRRTADAMRQDLLAKAEQEQQALVGKAQEEIRAERDRVFQELRAQVAELSLTLATRVVGETLDGDRQRRLVDQYIDELAGVRSNGNGHGGSRSSGPDDRPSEG